MATAALKYEGAIPPEKLLEMQGLGHESFRVKCGRRGPQGQLMSMKSLVLTIDDFTKLEDVLFAYAGGGRYTLRVMHPANNIEQICQLDISIEGPPKAVTPPPGGATLQRHTLTSPTVAPDTEWDVDREQLPRYATPQARHTPDEIAMQTVGETREEKRALEAKIDKILADNAEIVAKLQAKLDAERAEREKSDRQAEKDRHAAEIKRLEDLIRNTAEAKKAPSVLENLAAFAPFVPVLTALVSSRKDTEIAAQSQQTKAAEMQMELLKSTLLKQNDGAKGLTETLKVVLPLAGPLLTAWVASNGPKAQADLMAAQSDATMASFGMVAQLLEQATSGNESNPWLELAEKVLQGAAGIMEAAQANQNRPGVAQRVAAVAQQAAQIQAGVAPQTNGLAQRTQGEQVADQLLSMVQVPAELKTAEWHSILASLHDKDPAEEVAQNLANHIGNLDAAKQLPQFLDPLFSEPEKTFKEFFSLLPIWQMDMIYAKRVITKTIEILSAPPEGDEAEGEAADGDDAGATEGAPNEDQG